MNETMSHFTTAAVVVYALQWLKRSSLVSFITADTVTLNRWAGVVLAAASAVGVEAVYSSAEGTLLITGLSLAGIAQGVWHFLNQYALQQITYDAVVAKKGGA